MSALEFEAIAPQRLPLVAIVGNDEAWTQVRRGQVMMHEASRGVATRLSGARHDEVATALGGQGFLVNSLDQLASDAPSRITGMLGTRARSRHLIPPRTQPLYWIRRARAP